MPLYRLSVSTVSRAKGRSAVAAAAYRSGSRLVDERTGVVHDFRRKRGIVHRALIGWNGTRQRLWHSAELSEIRQDARTAREVLLALPRELNERTNIALAQRFGAWLHAAHGVAVDVCVHEPNARDDEPQPHAHLLCTTRRSGGTTLGEKARELDNPQTASSVVAAWRQAWAEMVNAALANAGVGARVEHRSRRRRGDRDESIHIPRAAVAAERRGEATEAGDRARRVRRKRGARRAAVAWAPTPSATIPEAQAATHAQDVDAYVEKRQRRQRQATTQRTIATKRDAATAAQQRTGAHPRRPASPQPATPPPERPASAPRRSTRRG